MAQCHAKGVCKREAGGRREGVRDADVSTGAEAARTRAEDGGRGHAPRQAGGLCNLEEARKQLLSCGFQKERTPADTWISSP